MAKRKPKIILATEPSDSGGPPYEIRLGRDFRVWCTCIGWRYSAWRDDTKDHHCKHLTRFRQKFMHAKKRRKRLTVVVR